MSSVTKRIANIKQPFGGFIRPSEFNATLKDDCHILNTDENVHGIIIGLCVDYLTRFIMNNDKNDSFKISIKGAILAELLGKNNSLKVVKELLDGITGLNDESIISACKLVTFDVWARNPIKAFTAKGYDETNPNKATISNIRILVNRSLCFFEQYGPIVKDGFTFEPVGSYEDEYKKMITTGKGSCGGYTATVSSGDGDFLTKDTLWDFKVSKSKPTNKHTLQLLMYWIMGQHSGQNVFKKIDKLGIFNPRLNTVYILDINKLSKETIRIVENEIICY